MTVAVSLLLIACCVMLVVLVLLHKGRGGGLSSLFGGGMTSTLSGSSVVERNLDRITLAIALVWTACIVVLNLTLV